MECPRNWLLAHLLFPAGVQYFKEKNLIFQSSSVIKQHTFATLFGAGKHQSPSDKNKEQGSFSVCTPDLLGDVSAISKALQMFSKALLCTRFCN